MRKSGFEILDGVLMPIDYGTIFAKNPEGEALCKEYSDFLDKYREDGTLEEIDRNWMSPEGEAKMAADSDNQLSYGIIRRRVDSIRHEAISDGEYTNLVTMKTRPVEGGKI